MQNEQVALYENILKYSHIIFILLQNGWSLGRFETFIAKTNVLFSFGLLDVCFTYNSVGFKFTNGGESVRCTPCLLSCVSNVGLVDYMG
jgi:hypothetical protein